MVDILFEEGRISVPVPLKHHTETAYMLILAVATALSGFVASILPHLPGGFLPWGVFTLIAAFYPFVLSRTLKENRADYEFRALHYAPVIIFIAWIFFEVLGPKVRILHILHLGFFFLWSLPLVALTISFLILFSLHVIRRWIPRVTLLSLLLALFTAGAVAAEAWHINPKIQGTLFSEQDGVFTVGQKVVSNSLSSLFALVTSPHSSGSLAGLAVENGAASSKSIDIDGLQMKSSLPPAIAVKKPKDLSASGPENIALLSLSLLSLYSITLHLRARRRFSEYD